MTYEPVKTIIKDDGHTIRIYPALDVGRPEPQFTFALAHGRHNLAWDCDLDQSQVRRECGSWGEVLEMIHRAAKDAGDPVIVSLAVYMLDHSGLVLQASAHGDPFRQFYMGLDSGQVGFIYATRSQVQKYTRYNTVLKWLAAEVDLYSQYVSGDVYDITVEGDDGWTETIGDVYGLDEAVKIGERYVVDPVVE